MKKLLVSCLCLAFILSSLSFSAFAQSDHKVKVKTSDGREVNITIKPGLESKVSQDMLTDLANENPNTDNITILDVGIASEPVSEFSGSQKPPHNELLNNSLMVTVPYPIPFTLTKTQTAADVFESDRFMDSCAKGETKTVSSTITASLSPQYTGIVVGLTLNGTISYSITKGSTLVGPFSNRIGNGPI